MERKKLKLKAKELIKGRVFRIFFFIFIVTALVPIIFSTTSSIALTRLFYANTTVAKAGQSIPISGTHTYTTALSQSEWNSKLSSLDLVGCLRLGMDRASKAVVVEGDRYFASIEAEKKYTLTAGIIEVVIFFATLLTAGALTFSGLSGMLKVDKDKKAPSLSKDFLTGFKKANYSRAILAHIRIGIFTFLWSLLFVIPGIIKAYSYIMTMYILADNPKLSAKEAQKKSIAMMRGHRFEYFKLQLSFFWWYLLVGITFGLAGFYVTPYVETSKILFYKKLAQK